MTTHVSGPRLVLGLILAGLAAVVACATAASAPSSAADAEPPAKKLWIFASYFNRMKAQVREQWRPAQVGRRLLPADETRTERAGLYTLLKVELDAAGQLNHVSLVTSSSVAALDQAALEAFRAAAPFPNPPVQLVTPQGVIDFHFGFYFDVRTQGTKFKVFRYRDWAPPAADGGASDADGARQDGGRG